MRVPKYLRFALVTAVLSALAFCCFFELAGAVYFRLNAESNADGPVGISAFIVGLEAGIGAALSALVVRIYVLYRRKTPSLPRA